jgi:hypothetical protein
MSASFNGTFPYWWLQSCASLNQVHSSRYRFPHMRFSYGLQSRITDTCNQPNKTAAMLASTVTGNQNATLIAETISHFRGLHLMGDSVGHQTFRALRCALEAASWSRNRTSSNPGHEREVWVRHSHQHQLGKINLDFSWVSSFPGASLGLQFANRSAEDSGQQSLLTVVLLGAWYNDPDRYERELDRFSDHVCSLQHEQPHANDNSNPDVPPARVGRGKGSSMIALVEPLPQHFMTDDKSGVYPGPTAVNESKNDHCVSNVPLDVRDFRIKAFDRVAARHAACGEKLYTLSFWKTASSLGYTHAASGMPGATWPEKTDCTHYCLPLHYVLLASLTKQLRSLMNPLR